jgi:hypothetical protein
MEHDPKAFRERQAYHYKNACQMLREEAPPNRRSPDQCPDWASDPTVASTLVMCLDTICRGDTKGEYRAHLNATKELVLGKRSSNNAFNAFLFEFFTYHDTINVLTTLDRRPLQLMDGFQLPQFIVQPEAGSLLGVLDGLFGYISRITKLRDVIRLRKERNLEPVVDYQIVSEAAILDAGIRSWVSAQKEDSPRYIASQLYRQCTWIYLYRSLHPSEPSEKVCAAVDEGLTFLRQLPPDASTQSILLMPLFLLGCAAFLPEQRPEIRRAFGTLKRYSNLGNIEPAREVVEKVWQRMDAKDPSSWDWETIIKEMGYDFLVT